MAALKCENCKKEFRFQSEKNRHLARGCKVKGWGHKCTKCGVSFKTEDLLKDHINSKEHKGK